jgi:hypothetical protein
MNQMATLPLVSPPENVAFAIAIEVACLGNLPAGSGALE